MKATDLTPAFKVIARRLDLGVVAFRENLAALGGLTPEQAITAAAKFAEFKLIKTDLVSGKISVKHGAYLDRLPIRRAAGIEA